MGVVDEDEIENGVQDLRIAAGCYLSTESREAGRYGLGAGGGATGGAGEDGRGGAAESVERDECRGGETSALGLAVLAFAVAFAGEGFLVGGHGEKLKLKNEVEV